MAGKYQSIFYLGLIVLDNYPAKMYFLECYAVDTFRSSTR
jgi:hypothetical protein